jgi:hypothetical protein
MYVRTYFLCPLLCIVYCISYFIKRASVATRSCLSGKRSSAPPFLSHVSPSLFQLTPEKKQTSQAFSFPRRKWLAWIGIRLGSAWIHTVIQSELKSSPRLLGVATPFAPIKTSSVSRFKLTCPPRRTTSAAPTSICPPNLSFATGTSEE